MEEEGQGLTKHELEILERWTAEGRTLIPGAEKTAIQIHRMERDATRWLVARKASEFFPQHTEWLWRDRIPVGELTLIVGRGNVGKSTVLAEQSGWITTGRMKGIHYGTPKPVIYVVNEDSIEKTVLPRMMAAGANPDLVTFLEVQTVRGQDALELPRDGERIRDMVKKTGSVAVFVDPLSANIDGDTNKGKEMRRSFQAVRRIAEDMQIAIVGLGHTRKAQTTNMVEALLGSAEQGNVARAILGVVADPETEGAYILSQEKNNLGPTNMRSFRYQLESAHVMGGIRTSRLKWLEETQTTASDVLADEISGQGSTSEAVDWLKTFLEQQGPTTRREVIAAGQKEGISRAAIGRAKTRLKVHSVRSSVQGGAATWSLPVADSGIIPGE